MNGKLAYLFPAFPVFHQTFVLWEVLGMKRAGLDPLIFSLRRGTEKQQDEAKSLIDEVVYLPGPFSRPVLLASLRALLRSPLRYLGLYLDVVRAWRTGADVAREQEGWESRPLKLRDRLRGWYNRNPLLYLLKSWALVPQAVELAGRLERAGVSHLHVHWATYPATVAYIIHRATGMPFSISAHAYDIYMVSRMLPAKVAAARYVFTCARANAAHLRKLAAPEHADKVVVSYHGVDIERFAPPAARPPHDRLRIVSCGQLERYKGMHLLVEACATLHGEGIALECWIVGEGPYRQHLEEQIERSGMTGLVHLTGAQPHSEVARLLAEADVFALASELGGKSGRRDVIANVIVEAMAAGLPAIASRIPGAEELVEDGVNGFLVRPNRAEEVANALRRLAADPAERERIGAAAREKIVRDFDNRRNVSEMAGVLAAAAGITPREAPR
jgi:glycosyltransferase involved in cell wall biosynthesis